MSRGEAFDVVILGGGLAGLTLARQLLLETDRTVLLLERKEELPGRRQKVGESTVQLAGWYLAKVLDLEEHLLDHHYMKYNLRFYWPAPGSDGASIEDYSQSYIRSFSNVPSYQVDRNRLEAELLALCCADPRFRAVLGAREVAVEWGEGETPHRVAFEHGGVRRHADAGWVVDATGRARLTARRRGTARKNRVRHGAFFWWVDGRVDVDRLTDLSPKENRLRRDRAALGHVPGWLATCHFVGDGFWFWVIPLQGKTSLGLVYDSEVIPHDEVFSVDKATEWVCRRFPLFARDLPERTVLDFGGYRDYSHDCTQTLSAERWASVGEAGRFSDPLYSPGSDLIAIYNTLTIHAIEAPDAEERRRRCRLGESLERAVYEAYLPTYEPGYRALGDPETFALKYGWELAVYFAAYVFPFINHLFTERRFVTSYLRFFSTLGPFNRNLQELLTGFAQWKAAEGIEGPPGPKFFDFTDLGPLARANQTFFQVGLTVEEARRVLTDQLDNLTELARFIVAHVAAVVAGDPHLATRRAFVEGLDPATTSFDPDAFRHLAAFAAGSDEPYPWSFCPRVLDRYRTDAEATRGSRPQETLR